MGTTFWDRIAGIYDLAERFNRRAVQEMTAETVRRLPPGCGLLECAAGTGAISLAAAPSVRHVWCTDLSLPMLDQARAKAGKLGLSNIEFAQRDLFHLPEPSGTYGAVCAANVLHLLDSPEAAVRELWRVTAPGGVLLLPTFLQGQPGALMKVLLPLYKLLGFRPRHAWTAESYRAFFENMGLPPREMAFIPGRLPVGLAVLEKPALEESL